MQKEKRTNCKTVDLLFAFTSIFDLFISISHKKRDIPPRNVPFLMAERTKHEHCLAKQGEYSKRACLKDHAYKIADLEDEFQNFQPIETLYKVV